MGTEISANSSDNFKDGVSYISKIKYGNYNLDWTIEDFDSVVCKGMKFIESKKFPPIKSHQGQWFLRLEPTELKDNSQEIFKVHIKGVDDFVRYMDITVIFCNTTGEKHKLCTKFYKFTSSCVWSVESSKLFKSLRHDNLTPNKVRVTCKLRVLDCINNEVEKPPINFSKYEDNFLHQMDKLFYENDNFKDVTFSVEKQEFQAHKAILAVRSPVFDAMFRSKMSEETTSAVLIEDISSTIFEKLLEFIYTDQVDELEEFAFEIFYAAEKYQLLRLKNLCINSLFENLSLKTVVQTVELANMFSISDLKNYSLKFLVSHLQKIKESLEYVKLMNDCPHLAVEIVEKMNEIKKENEETEDSSEPTVYELR